MRFIESWGTGEGGVSAFTPDYEAGIIEAARQSTQGSFRGWQKDAKLLEFLYTHKHSTPFEFAGMTLEIQAPIMVFREWQRHRTQSYSEMSARYEPLPDFTYTPTFQRLFRTQAGNKQAQGLAGTVLTPPDADSWLDELQKFYTTAEWLYQRGLNAGIPKELARLVMPVGHYSRMRATANLRNWLAFLTLRMDPAAQEEIRLYANIVGEIISKTFPRTWRLFEQQSSAVAA